MMVKNQASRQSSSSALPELFRRLALGFNLALLLAAPVFLVFTYGAAKGGAFAVFAALIFSAAGLFIFLVTARTWGGFFLANAVVILLAPPFTWYVATFAALPGTDAVDALVNSDMAEAVGFLSMADLWMLVAAWASAFILYLSFSVALWNRSIHPRLRTSYRYSIVPALLIALALPVKGETGEYSFDPVRSADVSLLTSYPVGALAGLVGSIAHALSEREDQRETGPYRAHLIADDGARETHILVIGESARFDAFHVNGYYRATSPQLDQTSGLVSYRYAYAPSNVTTSSVTLVMTGFVPESYGDSRKQGGILKAAHDAGYYTTWLSNNTLSFARHLGARENTCLPAPDRRERNKNEFIWEPTHFDNVLLPCLDRELDKAPIRKFIVLHTYGSHWDYVNRLPDNGFHFSGPTRAIAAERRSTAAEWERPNRDIYDDTIAYTDWFLGQIIQRAEKLPGRVTLTYFSDHGESFRFLDGIAGHARPAFSMAEAHIPLFFWANHNFVVDRFERWKYIEARQDAIFRTDGLFHTLASMMGITFDELDRSRDLTNADYRSPSSAADLTILAWNQLKTLKDAVNWSAR